MYNYTTVVPAIQWELKAPSVEGLSPSFREGVVSLRSLLQEDSSAGADLVAGIVTPDRRSLVESVFRDDFSADDENDLVGVDRFCTVDLHVDVLLDQFAVNVADKGERHPIVWGVQRCKQRFDVRSALDVVTVAVLNALGHDEPFACTAKAVCGWNLSL